MARPTNTQFAVAVHILTMLAGQPQQLQSSEELAASVGTNPVHIRRVLARLREAGLVSSRPGPRGGWQILAPPDQTTLADVWRVINGADPILGVHQADPGCPVGQRIKGDLQALDRRALAAIEAELAASTLADLVAQAPPSLAAA